MSLDTLSYSSQKNSLQDTQEGYKRKMLSYFPENGPSTHILNIIESDYYRLGIPSDKFYEFIKEAGIYNGEEIESKLGNLFDDYKKKSNFDFLMKNNIHTFPDYYEQFKNTYHSSDLLFPVHNSAQEYMNIIKNLEQNINDFPTIYAQIIDSITKRVLKDVKDLQEHLLAIYELSLDSAPLPDFVLKQLKSGEVDLETSSNFLYFISDLYSDENGNIELINIITKDEVRVIVCKIIAIYSMHYLLSKKINKHYEDNVHSILNNAGKEAQVSDDLQSLIMVAHVMHPHHALETNALYNRYQYKIFDSTATNPKNIEKVVMHPFMQKLSSSTTALVKHQILKIFMQKPLLVDFFYENEDLNSKLIELLDKGKEQQFIALELFFCKYYNSYYTPELVLFILENRLFSNESIVCDPKTISTYKSFYDAGVVIENLNSKTIEFLAIYETFLKEEASILGDFHNDDISNSIKKVADELTKLDDFSKLENNLRDKKVVLEYISHLHKEFENFNAIVELYKDIDILDNSQNSKKIIKSLNNELQLKNIAEKNKKILAKNDATLDDIKYIDILHTILRDSLTEKLKVSERNTLIEDIFKSYNIAEIDFALYIFYSLATEDEQVKVEDFMNFLKLCKKKEHFLKNQTFGGSLKNFLSEISDSGIEAYHEKFFTNYFDDTETRDFVFSLARTETAKNHLIAITELSHVYPNMIEELFLSIDGNEQLQDIFFQNLYRILSFMEKRNLYKPITDLSILTSLGLDDTGEKIDYIYKVCKYVAEIPYEDHESFYETLELFLESGNKQEFKNFFVDIKEEEEPVDEGDKTLPVLTSKDAIKVAERNGFVHTDTIQSKRNNGGKGSHRKYYNPDSNITLTIPFHNEDIPKGTLGNIIKISQIPLSEWKK